MGQMRNRVSTIRNWIWVAAPALGAIEVALRSKMATRRCWDLALIAQLERSNATAVDVGANIGIYARVLADRFTTVHAFEPNDLVANRLAAAAPANVQVHRLGLSDAAGTGQLVVPITAGSPQWGLASLDLDSRSLDSIVVPAELRALDSLGLAGIDFVKIDVEGHELSVLDGALDVLRNQRPRWILVECEQRHRRNAVGSVVAQLHEFAYRGWFPWEETVLAVEEFEADVHQPPSLAGTSDRRYAHMFLFCPTSAPDPRPNIRNAWDAVR